MPQRCLGCNAEVDASFRACPHCGDVITDFARRYSTELLDGKYEILQRLGAGGMGEVYLARHAILGATRVIKVVRAQISESADAHERFLREARAATKVQHPSVAMLHDFSALPDGAHYMVWEYIDGENLAQRLRREGILSPRQAIRIAIQALQGLEAIHRAGIVHRDISPENLMITREDEAVKIIDLGVAKLDDPTEIASTQTGIFVGKLRYASPEQLGFLPAGERIDARADVYAVGMVLYEMLVGRPPYEAKSPHEYFLLHAREPDESTAKLPPEMPAGTVLQALLDRALARDRNARFSRAAEFAAALQEVDRLIEAVQESGTVAVRLDADETLRQITERYDTLRSAPATVRTGVGAAKPSSSSRNRLLAVTAGVILVLAIGGYLMWPRTETLPPQPQPESPLLNVAIPSGTARTERVELAAETSVNVVAPSVIEEPQPELRTEEKPLEPPAATRTTPVAKQEPPRRETPRVEKQAATAEEPAPPASKPSDEPETTQTDVPVYVDGGGDASVNRMMVRRLRDEVGGVTKVSVHAGAMQEQLVRSIREHMPHLEVVDSAAVVIRFEGTLERLGMGRKRREGHGSVFKDGRLIFRYELPDEVFRVGMTPPDAFARILSDGFVR